MSISNQEMMTAHQLNSIVLFEQWLNYLQPTYYPSFDWSNTLIYSSHIRPTWANTYVELGKITESPNRAHSYEKLASYFGPHNIASQLLVIDKTFTNWQDQALDVQIATSQKLINLARSWRHRTALNTMITYSDGKHRICNLLNFNRLTVKACA